MNKVHYLTEINMKEQSLASKAVILCSKKSISEKAYTFPDLMDLKEVCEYCVLLHMANPENTIYLK